VLDPFVLYIAINTSKVPILEHRQAILAAMNRQTILTAVGVDFAGQEGDGIIKPTLGIDYAPTGLWTGLLGREVPVRATRSLPVRQGRTNRRPIERALLMPQRNQCVSGRAVSRVFSGDCWAVGLPSPRGRARSP
jgi:hypothetical protein